MASVCVGDGLKVVGGQLVPDVAEACNVPGTGVTVNSGGQIDYVVPTLVRRTPASYFQTSSASGFGYDASSAKMVHFSTEHDSAGGILDVQSDGSIDVLCDGVYALAITGGPTVSTSRPDIQMYGGWSRMWRNGTVIMSQGMVERNSYTGTDFDGPEINCSTVYPLDAGDSLTFEIVAVVEATGIPVYFNRPINIVSIARLGSIREP